MPTVNRDAALEQACLITAQQRLANNGLRDNKAYLRGYMRSWLTSFEITPNNSYVRSVLTCIRWKFKRLMGGEVYYRNFWIGVSSVSYASQFDYWWQHEDFDGAEDANDHRCGYAGSIDECKKEIDTWYEENEA